MANLQLFFEKHADIGRKVLIFASFSPGIGTFSDMKVWQKSAKMRNFSSIWRTFALI